MWCTGGCRGDRNRRIVKISASSTKMKMSSDERYGVFLDFARVYIVSPLGRPAKVKSISLGVPYPSWLLEAARGGLAINVVEMATNTIECKQ